MKRKLLKLLTLVSVITVVSAVPVFAQEVTDPTKVIMEETFNANESLLANDFHRAEITRCGDYEKYLDGVIYNLNEVVRIKQEVVTNYKYLSQYNPYYSTLTPSAERDLAQAKAWVEYYKQYKSAVQKDFNVRYNR